MQKKLKLAVLAMCCAPSAFAQTQTDSIGYHSEAASEAPSLSLRHSSVRTMT